ncbi:MAG TPA: NADH-quinone oxidoreductase subunit J [Rhizobiaceae bacterium]|nr:NADH-quinone oxidoreductase subunit J [Rhizobiaceae bacterium]
MDVAFYIAAAVAAFATLRVITHVHVVHALLYLVISFLAVSIVLYLLGAPFIAALEVIIYAGAIMVLFVFVVMMLNLGAQQVEQERRWLPARMWIGPGFLAAVLLGEVLYLLWDRAPAQTGSAVGPREVGLALFGPYVLAVELGSLLLLAGLIGAYHFGRGREREG